jgi:hypothetical protein
MSSAAGDYGQTFLEIVRGERWCIHDFLGSLLVVAEADSVGLVDLAGQKATIECESTDKAASLSAGKLLSDSGFQELLREEQEPGRPNFYVYGPAESTGRLVGVLAFDVWHRQAEPNVLKSYRLVLVSPRVLSSRALIEDGLESMFAIPALAHLWFTWASYQREKGKGLCDALRVKAGAPRGELDRDRQALLDCIVWPMPFESIIEFIEAHIGLPEKVRDEDAPWPDRVRRRLHFPADGALCPVRIRGTIPPCRTSGEPGLRERFESLAKLIEWRSAWVRHGEAVPREPLEADYRALDDIKSLFLPRAQPDRLNKRSLACYFAHDFWREWAIGKKRGQQLRSPNCGPAERLRHFRYCTHVAHYVLTDMPADDEAIEAMVWAVSQYGHDVLGIEPRLDLRAHLLHAARNEPALHALKPFYRDHFFHAIEVCFLGHLLLETRVEEGLPLYALVRDLLGFKTREEVLREWYVAALLHDIGYSVEVLRGAREALGFYERSENIARLGADIDEALKRLSANLAAGGIAAVQVPGLDHGPLGEELLRGLLQRISKHGQSVRGYEAARRAIAVHSQLTEVVEFRKEPLTFLLILCDAIQEWNRLHLWFSAGRSGILSSLMRGTRSGNETDLTGPLDVVALNLKLQGDHFRLRKTSSLELTMTYGDRVNRNSSVFNLWIGSSLNLQRLRLDGLPSSFNIVTRYKTPAFINDLGRTEWQMDRLKSAAEETNMKFLERWFPSGEGNRAVRYEQRDRRYEIVTLDLRELTREERITEPLDVFRDRLALWRNYNEDRDFPGASARIMPV